MHLNIINLNLASLFLIWTSLVVVYAGKIPKCEGEGFLPDPMDCTKFYRCVDNRRGQNGSPTFDLHDFVCPANTCFDEKLSSCNFIFNPTTSAPPKEKITVEKPFELELAVDNYDYDWIYFEDQFLTNPNESGWIISTYPGVEKHRQGKFGWSPGIGFKDEEYEKGLLTLNSNSVYSISTKEFFPFSTKNNNVFILQYSTKETYEQNCAGSYIKLFDCSLDPLTLVGSTKHLMSFGPEQCGKNGRVIKLNLHHEDGHEYDLFKGALPKYNSGNSLTHVYTLIIYPDEMRSFEIKYDGNIIKSGNYKGIVPTFNGWDSICGIGIEVYQSNGGTIFDNILMTHDQQLASERVKEILRIVST